MGSRSSAGLLCRASCRQYGCQEDVSIPSALRSAEAGRDVQGRMCGWLAPETEPDREIVDWDLYLGPAAWRPYNKSLLDGFNFEKGGGLTGGGCLEWGSHCVDLCQWANDADSTAPVEYEP